MAYKIFKVRITNLNFWYNKEVYKEHILDVYQRPHSTGNYSICNTESNHRAFEAFHKENRYRETFTFSSLYSTPRQYSYEDVWIAPRDCEIIHDVKNNQEGLFLLRKDSSL